MQEIFTLRRNIATGASPHPSRKPPPRPGSKPRSRARKHDALATKPQLRVPMIDRLSSCSRFIYASEVIRKYMRTPSYEKNNEVFAPQGLVFDFPLPGVEESLLHLDGVVLHRIITKPDNPETALPFIKRFSVTEIMMPSFFLCRCKRLLALRLSSSMLSVHGNCNHHSDQTAKKNTWLAALI